MKRISGLLFLTCATCVLGFGLAGAKVEAGAEAVNPARVDCVARSILGLVGQPRDRMTQDAISTDTVQVALRLNQSEYKIGEPIAATFTVMNAGQQPIQFETGCDYRSGREQRFSFDVVHESGRKAPDTLATRVQYGLQGGLGSGATLAPGQSWRRTLLLNMYGSPRTPGVYTVKGRYRYREDSVKERAFQSGPATFRLLNKPANMWDSTLSKFLTKNGLDGLHPALLWGIRGNKKDIPALVQVMLTGLAPSAYPKPATDLASQNAQGDAAEGLLFMPWKEDVYRALDQAFVDGVRNGDSDLFRITYWCAAGPESVGVVEERLDHPDKQVRLLALKTALSLGGARASERLAEALRSPDLNVRDQAQEGAWSYLLRTIGDPVCRVEGLSKAHVDEYRSALLTAARDEPSTMILRRLVDGLAIGPEIPLDLIQLAQDENDPRRQQCMIEWLKVEIVQLHQKVSGKPRDALVSLARAELRRESVVEAQADAMILLGFLGDESAKEVLAEKLSSANEDLRGAAAIALFALHDEAHRDACIDTLSSVDPHRFVWEFRELSRRGGIPVERCGRDDEIEIEAGQPSRPAQSRRPAETPAAPRKR